MPAPIDPATLQMILAAAKKKQAQLAPQISLTPKDMSANDMQQKAMGLGLIDPTVPVQGGVDTPAPITSPQVTPRVDPSSPDEVAARAAEAARAKGAMPAPSPAPVAPAPAVGGQLGPGVQMAPTVTIKPSPPQAVLENKPSRSDMPDPHAPDGAADDGADEEPDDDEDDVGDLPFRFAV